MQGSKRVQIRFILKKLKGGLENFGESDKGPVQAWPAGAKQGSKRVKIGFILEKLRGGLENFGESGRVLRGDA